MSEAAQRVCDELTPLLQSYAREAGLDARLAASLTLVWTGETFTAQSPLSLDDAEYGSGEVPSPRPVHKALNRLEQDAERLLTDLVRASAATREVVY